MAKKGLIIFGIAATLLAAGLGSWQFYFKDTITLNTSSEGVAYVTKVSSLTGESMGVQNWYAGVVEAQNTVKVKIESGRKVSEVKVNIGDLVKKGDLLFEYDLSSLEDDLKQKQLDLDKLYNEAQNYAENIATLEREKTKANQNQQLSYTIEIETARMNLKQNEYNQTKKLNEIERLRASMTDTQVLSTLDGVIQKIDTSKLSSDDGDTLSDSFESDDFGDSSSDDSFITILGTGNYRVKGMINEQNRSELVVGQSMIIRSRADDTQTWTGSLQLIDEQNAKSNSNDMFGYTDSSESQTSSSTYPFYVELDSSDGLMLGQHVYIEKDVGQASRADGLWIFDVYVVDADTEAPYVWAAGSSGKLEKRYVVLGEHDDLNFEYRILDGLTAADSVAEPDETLEEGMDTADSSTKPIEDMDYSGFEGADGFGEDDFGEYDFSEEMMDEDDWDLTDFDTSDWDTIDEDDEDVEYEEDDGEIMVIDDDEFDMDFMNMGPVYDSDDVGSAG